MLVTGIGQCSWDILAVMDSYPAVDTKKEVEFLKEQGGGPVATALVALSRLGVSCRFVGVTGDDLEGRKIRESLVNEDIEVSGLVTRKGFSSQFAFIAIEREGGKRTIFWRRPTGLEIRPGELGESFLEKSDFLLLDGLMRDASLHAAQEAKKLNIPVMLDAGSLRDGMIDLARCCDYVVGSERFARGLGWDGNVESFRGKILELGFGLTTVTLGAKGSITFAANKIIKTPAFQVDAVDTTGAGDVFHGGYIYGLIQGWNMERTLAFASAIAAMKCRKVGGQAGIPSLEEVNQFMEKSKLPALKGGGSNSS